jgi:hypothetical protein
VAILTRFTALARATSAEVPGVGSAIRDHVKGEMSTIKGSYEAVLTGYSETSEYLFARATRMAPEPFGGGRWGWGGAETSGP